MNHHDHDPDLIMALAEGRLEARSADRVRRDLDACAECAEDLALQEAALAAFAAAPPVTLTELEAARLKRDLDTALGHRRDVVAPASPRRRFNWVPVFSVAAVLIAVVLVAPSLNLLGGGSDDSGADVVAFDAPEETDAQAESAAEAPPSADLELRSVDGADTDDFVSDEAATTTAAAAGDDGGLDDLGADELLTLLASSLDPAAAPEEAQLRASLFGLAAPRSDDDRCVSVGAAALDVNPVASYVLGDVNQLPTQLRVTAHPLRAELGLVAHDQATCEVLATSSD